MCCILIRKHQFHLNNIPYEYLLFFGLFCQLHWIITNYDVHKDEEEMHDPQFPKKLLWHITKQFSSDYFYLNQEQTCH